MKANTDKHARVKTPQSPANPRPAPAPTPGSPLTARQLAPQLGVHWQTVLRWGREGIIPSHRAGGKHVRFDLREVRQAMRENGMPQ